MSAHSSGATTSCDTCFSASSSSHNSSSNTDEDEEKIEDSYEFGQAPTASPALDLHQKDDEMSVSDMDDGVASSNYEAGEDGEMQIVLEEIEVPTMEPTLQSPNKTHWLTGEQRDLLNWLKDMVGECVMRAITSFLTGENCWNTFPSTKSCTFAPAELIASGVL